MCCLWLWNNYLLDGEYQTYPSCILNLHACIIVLYVREIWLEIAWENGAKRSKHLLPVIFVRRYQNYTIAYLPSLIGNLYIGNLYRRLHQLTIIINCSVEPKIQIMFNILIGRAHQQKGNLQLYIVHVEESPMHSA